MGDVDTALACIQTGNFNMQSPYTIYEDSMYPIHCAAHGGNLDLLKYMINDQGCSLTSYTSAGVKVPCLTKSGQSVMSIAANRGHVHIMRWLVVEKGLSVRLVRR